MADNGDETPPAREPQRGLGQLDAGGASVAQGAIDPELQVVYQRSGQVRQNLAELRIAQAHGQTDRATAARKTLIALGVDVEALEAREAAQSAAADKPVDASRQPPEGRSTTPPAQVKTASTPEVRAPLGGPQTPGPAPSGGKAASSSATPASSGAKSTPPAPPAPPPSPPSSTSKK